MLRKTFFSNVKDYSFTNYRQAGTAVKLLKFSLLLIFGAVLLLGAAQTARADNFIVDRTDDANVSGCAASTVNDCTLRGAITAANASPADDTITFDSAVFRTSQSIRLIGGELSIANNGTLTINGTGVKLLTIDGNNQSRVFYINNLAVVNISNLTITGGRSVNLPGSGGGIYNLGTLVVDNSEITGNSASPHGGGIYSNSDLTISNSTISNNSAENSGGGIYNTDGFVRVTNSTINDNISGSTGGSGGGIRNTSGGILLVTNSTVYRNTGNNGGGISSDGSTFNLMSSTVSNNRADPFFGVGGGILSGGGNTRSLNSIIADNNAANAPDFSGTLISQGYNLIENTSLTIITGNTNGNILGQDPQLDPNGLQDNGGATLTVSLLRGSPAIDAADPANFPADDQRGVMRPIDGDNNGSALPDIGAFETERILIVTKTADTDDGVCDADCSLREAIANANSTPTDERIMFDADVFGSKETIILTGGDLRIENNGKVSVNGAGANLVTISGNNQSRIFSIKYQANLTVNNINITDGNGIGSIPDRNGLGGGIFTEGTLNLNRVNINNCSSSGSGGIYIGANLPVTVSSSTFTNNFGGAGGGIRKQNFGSLTISDTTFVNNRAAFGGAVYSLSGTTSITDSLIVNNIADDSGGGFYGGGVIEITNTPVVSNTAVAGGGGIRSDGSLYIRKSDITNNSSAVGGGIASYGFLTIIDSTIDGNESGFGGGISKYTSASAIITGSTISNNTASDGAGGIFNSGTSGVMTLINSTVSGNTAAQDGGGINNISNLSLINVTVAGNSAISGGGIINVPGTVNARNTIIADNSSEDFFGSLNSQGFILIENTTNTNLSATAPGAVITGRDPQLLPLANNGGTTKTHALRPTSPAIDAGLLTGNPLILFDQRGLPRPVDFPNVPNAAGGDGSDIGAFELQSGGVTSRTRFDFDGDGKADVSVFRPSNGVWYLDQSQNGFTGVTFGLSSDLIAPADFDGDGKTDVAVFRPSNGTWYILNSSDNSFSAVQFGQNGDIPRPADFDGDGKADINVFRPSNGAWYRLDSSSGEFVGQTFGQNGDKPLIADFDSDSKSDLAVFRPSNGTFYWLSSINGGFNASQFGLPTDIPTPADYDGDGKTDIAVFRPTNGAWYRLNSSNGGLFIAEVFGQNGDVPVAADYDGDGKADIAVFRSSNATWYLNQSTSGFTAVNFGLSTDSPVPAAFIR